MEETLESDRTWAYWAGGILVIAFLAPLVLGPKVIFFPELIKMAPYPGIKLILIVPAILGVVALVAAVALDGLKRAVTLLIAAGTANILIMAVGEAWADAVIGLGPRLPPEFLEKTMSPNGTLLIAQLCLTLCFVGLAVTIARPNSRVAPLITGYSGLGVLLMLLSPFDGLPIRHAFSETLWQTIWVAPVVLLMAAAFGLLCMGVMLMKDDRDSLARMGLGLGGGLLLAPAIGILMMLNDVAGVGQLAMVILVLLKGYGTVLAMHGVFAGGMVGLLLHGLEPEEG